MFRTTDKKTKIIILSAIGFVITGILAYPFGIHWDSAHTFSCILSDGHAKINNWLGWYFPLLWEKLYKLTGIRHILGCYINLVYWIGVTLLYLHLFDARKHSLWLYVAFAWFPGTLCFIINITNNALMFVNLIMGLAFYAVYRKKGAWYWLVLSIVFCIQCMFIRREAFIIAVPLVAIMFYLLFKAFGKKPAAVMLSLAATTGIFALVEWGENAATSQIPGYRALDALSCTSLTDMAACSYLTGENQFPLSIFKDEYKEGCQWMDTIMSADEAKIINGDFMFHRLAPFVEGGDTYSLLLPRGEIGDFYCRNLPTYLWFRAKYISHFLYDFQNFLITTGDTSFAYTPSKPHAFFVLAAYLCAWLFPLRLTYLLTLFVMFMDWRKKIRYGSGDEKVMIRGLILISWLSTGLCLFTSMAPQYRYVYPVCALQYMIFIYLFRDRLESLGKRVYDNLFPHRAARGISKGEQPTLPGAEKQVKTTLSD